MKKILILMSTYNGEKYLCEQLDSLLAQEGVEVNILIRDDGSTDSTKCILQEYQEKYHIGVIWGENIGWKRSFMELIYNSPDSNYYAFCDQDDIWLPQKLEVAIEKLEKMPVGHPNLYCSNLIYYRNGQKLGLVKKTSPNLTLQLSLMRSLAAGCTMVFNKELKDAIVNHKPQKVTAHDFWTYQVASLLGNVYYDINSYILYRQHDNNQIGASVSRCEIWKKRLVSAKKNFYCGDRQNAAKELLRLYSQSISDSQLKKIKKVADYNKNIKKRLSLFFDNSFSMGGFANDFWLRIRILFGKI